MAGSGPVGYGLVRYGWAGWGKARKLGGVRMAKPSRVCSVPGCPLLAVKGGRCGQHQREAWAGRRGFEGYGPDYQRMRRQVLREEPMCRICGVRPAVSVDHIIPVAQGGTHARGNLRGLCRKCHDARSKAQSAEGRRRA